MHDTVTMRKFPYPYKSMFAIANDVDNEEIIQFRELHRFFNTKEKTQMGEGLGLDIGDSFWMYGPEDLSLITYWKGYQWKQDNHKEEILRYIKCGWIDSIHSFGDFNDVACFTREHAVRSIDELKKNNLKLKVWINHGNANNIQNFPSAFMTHKDHQYMKGDLPGSQAYHTDLTIPYGIQFVQDYTMNDKMGHSSILRPISLWDGQQIWGFRRLEARAESFWRKGLRLAMEHIGIQLAYWNWHPEHLGKQLSQENLKSIIDNQQYSIIGQHLGIRRKRLPKDAVQGLERLKEKSDSKEILVARLSRLLEYNRVHQCLTYQVDIRDNKLSIDIKTVNDPVCGEFFPLIDHVRGITFTNVINPQSTTIYLNSVEVPNEELIKSEQDKCIGIRWFTPDYNDYSLK